MKQFSKPAFATDHGYLTQRIQQQYIASAVKQKLLPEKADRMPDVLSLEASEDSRNPIQFWQLYSVLGSQRIVAIVRNFYQRVFADEAWFSDVFERVGGVEHHVNTQASMWVDVMGGGAYYHGGEYRLSFHHTHNAMSLMNDKGTERWMKLMVETLNDPGLDLSDDPRVRPAINTFLSWFFGKYAQEFGFANTAAFGDTNPPLRRRINFLNLSSDAIEALTEAELQHELAERGFDVSEYQSKAELVNKALSL